MERTDSQKIDVRKNLIGILAIVNVSLINPGKLENI